MAIKSDLRELENLVILFLDKAQQIKPEV